MGLNIVQKILAAHCGSDVVKSAGIINASVDMVFSNELSDGIAIKHFES